MPASYLIDRQNPTGYSQRLVCMVGDTQLNILGDDVLFQWTPGSTHSLAYDGQGVCEAADGPQACSLDRTQPPQPHPYAA